ncbi:hypothetical protein BaRGS_00000591 [Batillaria attramentaria]|uniref:Uncharacterized protein n=1 Tax=Batillaria attramentaria TaxID=370345 RepID=A0ABD0M9C7_9CAEN
MDFIEFCPPVTCKKRKVSEEEQHDYNDNRPMEEMTVVSRQFMAIHKSGSVFQTEEWRSADTALFQPVTEDLMVNIRKVDQISCTDGNYFVADCSGKYSRTVQGKVLHLWRFDKTHRKLFISRSFLFTSIPEYLAVQRFLQQI